MKKIKIKLFNWINSIFSKFDYELIKSTDMLAIPKKGLTYSEDFLYSYHNAGFLKDTEFIEAYEKSKEADNSHLLKNYNIRWRIHVLCWASSQVINKEGDFVDCGGGSGIFASAILHYTSFNSYKKQYYLIDSFEGLNDSISSENEIDRSQKLYANINSSDKLKRVRTWFEKDNLQVVKGFIPDVLTSVNVDKISFLSIDLNSAIPEYECLKYFWPKMVSGGIIVLDDHGFLNQYEESMLLHEKFAKEHNVKILKLPTCQGILIKP